MAFAFASMLGAVGCSNDTVSADDEAGTTSTTSDTTGETEVGETSETGTETTETTSTSGSFYAGPDVDFGDVSECDIWSQDCPEGEKCVPYSSDGGSFDANKCVPVLGDGQPGDACNYAGVIDSTDDCGVDSFCFYAPFTGGAGECLAFCGGTPEDPVCDGDAPATCVVDFEGTVTLCVPNCDPLGQDCGDGDTCVFSDSLADFLCAPSTENATGEPCEFTTSCANGSFCAPVNVTPDCGGEGCCADFCDLNEGACSQDGTVCVPFFEEGTAPEGHENLGACILMP